MRIECGTDIVEIVRIKEAIENGGRPFLVRIFTDREIEYCESKNGMKYQSYAARFAAKEAVAKAFGTGMSGVYFSEIEVVSSQNTGKPSIELHGRALELYRTMCASSLSVSLSHSDNYATAMVVISFSDHP